MKSPALPRWALCSLFPLVYCLMAGVLVLLYYLLLLERHRYDWWWNRLVFVARIEPADGEYESCGSAAGYKDGCDNVCCSRHIIVRFLTQYQRWVLFKRAGKSYACAIPIYKRPQRSGMLSAAQAPFSQQDPVLSFRMCR